MQPRENSSAVLYETVAREFDVQSDKFNRD